MALLGRDGKLTLELYRFYDRTTAAEMARQRAATLAYVARYGHQQVLGAHLDNVLVSTLIELHEQINAIVKRENAK